MVQAEPKWTTDIEREVFKSEWREILFSVCQNPEVHLLEDERVGGASLGIEESWH